MIELDGDLDLFGDESILIHRSVGHTPGSEQAVVHLPKTGAIVLTSDAAYMSENIHQALRPSVGLAYDPEAFSKVISGSNIYVTARVVRCSWRMTPRVTSNTSTRQNSTNKPIEQK